jgi:amidase
MRVKGHRSSGGFLSTLETSEEDCDLVAILRSMGAVFYVKTNQPQGIMHGESQSFYQRTVNPNNINLSAGGSSGGEGALIAFKGSCLGLGSDIGP